jgi:hypothetical protein
MGARPTFFLLLFLTVYPDTLRLASRAHVGLDRSGAARILERKTILAPPPVARPPVRKLVFR